MSRPVDVLATLSLAANRCAAGDSLADDISEACAAVAELVAAANLLARRAENNIRSCGEIDMDGPELPNILAALAKFGGAA